MNELISRLNLILQEITSQKFLNNDGLGNEIGFWIFDYPPKYELIVRDHLSGILEKLVNSNINCIHLNVHQIIIEMLESRNIFDRACEREKIIGVEELSKTLAGTLSQEKIASFIQKTYLHGSPDLVLMSGLGGAWPLVRGHELLSALQDVMGRTPLVLFYPGTYSGTDLLPFGIIESKNYYRAFKLIPHLFKPTNTQGV